MTASECLILQLRRTHLIFRGMTHDLAPDEWLHRPTPQANCAAWIVSHCIVVEYRMLKPLTDTAPALPDPDFENRYGKGAADLGHSYTEPATLMPLFDTLRDRMIELVRELPDDAMDKPLDNPSFKTLGALLGMAPVHIAMHAGQLSTIRRSLGRPPMM